MRSSSVADLKLSISCARLATFLAAFNSVRRPTRMSVTETVVFALKNDQRGLDKISRRPRANRGGRDGVDTKQARAAA